MTKIIINEQHGLIEEQRQLLEEKFGSNIEMLLVPASGWTLEEMETVAKDLEGETVVFVSPIPFLLSALSFMSGYGHESTCLSANGHLMGENTNVFIFHNDNREKKELPNGKVIFTVAKTGWQLIPTAISKI